jgi:transcriptional regulator with XRE-family HTH domain
MQAKSFNARLIRRSLLMGQASREKPHKLPEKLLHIRLALKLSQNEMIKRLGLADKLTREKVSAFERGVREPSLPVLLQYARVARVWMDVLVDDELDLPDELPATAKYKTGLRGRESG